MNLIHFVPPISTPVIRSAPTADTASIIASLIGNLFWFSIAASLGITDSEKSLAWPKAFGHAESPAAFRSLRALRTSR